MMVQQPEHILLLAMTDTSFKRDVVNFLEKESYRLLFAATGEEVISIFGEHPEINIILINIDLPVINGIETITKIRQLDANVPIILMVTYITLESLKLAQNIGCNEILQTPVDQMTLEAIILKYFPC